MRVPLRSLLLGAGAGAAALTAALAPPASAAAPRIDAEAACNGGLYDIIIVERWPAARCLMDLAAQDPADWGPVSGFGWWRPTVRGVVVDRAAGTARVTIARDTAPNPVWLAWATADGTAKAGVDFTAASGKLAFDKASSTFTVPLLDDGDHGDGPRSFTVRFSNPTIAYVQVPPVLTVELPADTSYVPPVEPDPDPDPDPQPDPDPDPDPSTEPGPSAPADPAPADPGPVAEPAAEAPVTEQPRGETGPRAAIAAVETPAAAPAPTSSPAPAPSAPPLMARREQARTLASTVAGRTRLPVACASACTLTSRLTVSAATARRLGLRSRTVGRATAQGTGRVLVPLRLSAAARRALARDGRGVVATVTVTGAGGAPLVVRLTLAAG